MSRFLGRLVHGQLNNFKELIKNVDILRTCLDKVSRESRLQQNAMRRPILEEHHHENYCDTKENLRAKVEELIASGTVDERDDQNTRLQKWYELVRYYYYIKFTHPDGPEVFTVLKKQISESDKKDMYNLICSLLDEYIDDHLLDNSKPEDQADTIKLNDILEYRKRVLGEDHSHTIEMLNKLANAFYSKGEFDKAVSLFKECLTKSKRIFGEEKPYTINAINSLASSFQSKGDYDRALPLFEECLAKYKRVLGDDHPSTLRTLNNLANVYYAKGEYHTALSMFDECLAMRERVLGPDHHDTIETKKMLDNTNIAWTLQQSQNQTQNAGRNKNKSKNKVYSSKHKRKYFQSRRHYRYSRKIKRTKKNKNNKKNKK